MYFSYEDYLRECFSQPVFSLLWTLPFIIVFLIVLTALRRAHDPARRRQQGALALMFLCLLLIIGVPLHKQLGILVRTNGVAVLQDRNTAPLELTGVIEAIELPERSAETRFTYDHQTHYGVWLTIDGLEYYAVTNGTLDAGDTVIIEYLPKSRCVLYLAPAESTNAEE